MARYWIGVVHADHVRIGVAGGFAQLHHGRPAALRRMSPGDWLWYYSPRTSHDGAPLRAFTAAGRIADREPYQVEVADGFRPWRRDVDFADAVETPIEGLLDELSFTAGNRSWGLVVRRGHVEITLDDAGAIARAMGITVDG